MPVSRLMRVFWTALVGFPFNFRIFGILGGVSILGLWAGWSGDLFAAAERYGFGKVVAVKQCGRATVWLIG